MYVHRRKQPRNRIISPFKDNVAVVFDSSAGQRSIYWPGCIVYCCYNGLINYHSTIQPLSKVYRRTDVSMLALRVVTARVLVVLGGSFMPQIETGPTLTRSPNHREYTVYSACWKARVYTKHHACQIGVLNSECSPLDLRYRGCKRACVCMHACVLVYMCTEILSEW